jgi:hypothetical protein
MRRLTAALLPILLLAPGIAAAQGATTIIQPPPVMDEVTLELSAEDWVVTETALVTVVADAAAADAQAGVARGDLLAAVSGLVPQAEWRIVSFDRFTDQAGLDRWQAVAQARLPETEVGGLGEKARELSRPGLQIRVRSIEFTPTLAEVEAVRARLRAEIYRRADEEIAALERSFGDRDFRIGAIRFQESGMPPMPVQAMMSRGGVPEAMDKAAAAPVSVSEKLRVTAFVSLSALAPREP